MPRPLHSSAQSPSDPPLSSQTSAIAGRDTIETESAKMMIRNKRFNSIHPPSNLKIKPQYRT